MVFYFDIWYDKHRIGENMRSIKTFILIVIAFFLFIPCVHAKSVSIDSVEVESKSDTTKILEEATIDQLNIKFNVNFIEKDDYMGACESYISLIDGIYVKTFGSYKVGSDGDDRFPFIEIVIISLVLTFISAVLVYTKYQKPQRMIDQSIKSALNSTTMVVKCEHDDPLPGKNDSNS